MSSSSVVMGIFGRRYLRGGTRGSAFMAWVIGLDVVARVLLGRTRRVDACPVAAGGTIVVAKIDHLGDLLMITPFLEQLRRQAPSLRTVLLIGSWSAGLGEILREQGLADEIVIYDAWGNNNRGSLLSRIRRNLLTWRSARHRLEQLRPSHFVDLRPFSPNALLLARMAKVRCRVGFGLRGLSFTLHHELEYDPQRPLGQLFLNALPVLGLKPAEFRGPALGSMRVALDPELAAALPAEPFVVTHLGSRNPAREMPIGIAVDVLRRVAERIPVVAVGSAADAAKFSGIAAQMPAGRFVDLMGRTGLRDLFAIARASRGGMAVDSFVAHVLLGFERPTAVLMAKGFAQRASYPEGLERLWFIDSDELASGRGDQIAAFLAEVQTADTPSGEGQGRGGRRAAHGRL